MDELRDEIEALEAELRSGGNEVEALLHRAEQAALRLDRLAARADRLATRVRARLIADCRERLGAGG